MLNLEASLVKTVTKSIMKTLDRVNKKEIYPELRINITKLISLMKISRRGMFINLSRNYD